MPKGRIQNEDIKSAQELIDAGGFPQQLPNDSKIWLSARDLSKTLEQAILDGELLKGPTVIDLFDESLTTLPATTATQVDGETIVTGDIVLFTALSNPLENNRIYSAEVSGGNITWTLVKLNQNEDGDPIAGDFTFVTRGSAQFKLFYYTTLWEEFKSGGSGGGVTLLGGGKFSWAITEQLDTYLEYDGVSASGGGAIYNTSGQRNAYGFTVSGGPISLSSFTYWMRKFTGTTGTVSLIIANNVAGVPTGTVATSDPVDATTIGGSNQDVVFNFPVPIDLPNGNYYYYLTATGSLGFSADTYSDNPTVASNISFDGGSSWGSGSTTNSPNIHIQTLTPINALSFTEDMYLEVTGLDYESNLISSNNSPILLNADKKVAYVIPNDDFAAPAFVQQSLVSPASNFSSFAASSTRLFAVTDNGSNYDVRVWDITDPSNPIAGTPANFSRTGSGFQSVKAVGNILTISGTSLNSHLSVVDATNINSMTAANALLGNGSYGHEIHPAGQYLYIFNQGGQANIANITNPASPSVVATLFIGAVFDIRDAVALTDRVFGCAAGTRIKELRLSSPSSFAGYTDHDLAFSGNLINLAALNSSHLYASNSGNSTIDIMTIGALGVLTIAGTFSVGIGSSAKISIDSANNLLYAYNDATFALEVYDLSNPLSPSLLSSSNLSSNNITTPAEVVINNGTVSIGRYLGSSTSANILIGSFSIPSLPIVVDDLQNVPDEGIVIARRDGDEVIISGMRLRPGQTKKLYSEDDVSSFDVPNNSSAVDITGLVFDSNLTSSAIIGYEIYRRTDSSELSETGQIRVMYKPDAGTWQIDRDFSFDDTGCTITITSSGQLQIATTNLSGANYLGRMQWDIADKPAA